MFDDVKLGVKIPLKPVSKPRVTGKSWHARGKRFMAFRDAFHKFVKPRNRLLEGPLRVEIFLMEWDARQDIDNIAKSILDCLVGHVIASDSVKVVRDLEVRAVDNQEGGGFAVYIYE